MSALIHTEEFEDPFRSIVSELLDQTYAMYDSLREHMRTPWRERALKIQIVDDAALNAVVRRDGNSEQIRVNRGALEHIFGTMFGLFSCPTFLPKIGHAASEKMPPGLAGCGFPVLPLLPCCGSQLEQRAVLIPTDEGRASMAVAFGQIALEFLLLHEIGHIVGGLLDLPETFSNRAYIPETQWKMSGTDGWSFSHVLECDADAFACDHVPFVYACREVGDSLRNVAETTGWDAEVFAMIAYVTAVAVLFRVLYPFAPSKIDSCDSSHPHPAVRACLVASSTTARALFGRRITVATLNEVIGVAVRNVEDVWADLLLADQNPEPPDVWALNVPDAAMALFTDWGKARSRLERHARLPRRWDMWDWPREGQASD